MPVQIALNRYSCLALSFLSSCLRPIAEGLFLLVVFDFRRQYLMSYRLMVGLLGVFRLLAWLFSEVSCNCLM